MPLYEFQCQQCRHIFEELVRMGSNGEGLSCPQCGGAKLVKQVSACFGQTRSSASACQFADNCGDRCGGDFHACGAGCGCQ